MSRLAVLAAALVALAAVLPLPDRAAYAQSATDTTAPTVTGFRMVTAPGTYGEGDAITVAAVFSEAVTVTGEPRLVLHIGRYTDAAKYATGVSGVSATQAPFEVAFTYRIRAYLEDGDGVYVYPGALYLPSGASIVDGSGNDATLTHERALCCTNGQPTSGVLVDTRPAPPTEFKATRGSGQVTLSWTGPRDNSESGSATDPDITKWQVRRKAGTGAWGSWADIAGSSASTTSHTVTGLVNGTAYTFQVRAHDAGGAGKASDARTATPVGADTTRPAKPAGFTATAGSGRVILRWTNPSDGTIARWQVRRKAGTGNYGAWTDIANSGASTTSHVVTGLVDGTAYTFQIRAHDAGGAGAASDEKTATPVAADTTRPAKPAGFTATAGSGQVTLGWTNPSDSTIARWQVRRKTGTGNYGAWADIANSGASTTSHIVTGLVNGTAYTFQIRAVDAGGAGAASEEKTVTPVGADTTRPAKPAGFAATAGSGQVTLGWTNPSDSTITKWQVRRKTGTGNYGAWADIANSGATTTSYIVTGLVNGTAYTFQVRAHDAGGAGAASDEKTATPVAAGTGGPTVSGAPAFRGSAKTYKIGDAIEAVLTFDETIVVTGAPRLGIKIGTEEKNAACARHASNDTKLVCAYTVAEGDEDTDGIEIEANRLTLNGGAIEDGSDNAATLTHAALTVQSGRKVDGVRATVTGFRMVTAAGTYDEGDDITVAAVFSEAVTVTGVPRLVLLIGGYTRAAGYATGVTGVSATAAPFEAAFTYRVQANLADIDGVIVYPGALYLRDAAATIRDAAGNDATLTHERGLCCTNGEPTSGVLVDTRPAPPWRFRAAPGNAQVSLSWRSPPDNSATAGASDGTITKWQVRRKAGTGAWGAWTNIASSSASTTSHVVTNLVNGTTYAFQVRAHDAGGAGKASPARTAKPVAEASLASAAVRGDTMALAYDAVLDAASAPAASAFTVTAAGAERGVAGVSVRGQTVTLRLARAVGAADAVTVGYAPPADAVRLRDAGGAEAAAFTGVPAENATAPLKARLAAAPPEHGGEGEAITVRIAFSAPVTVGATKAVREGTVKVKGGRVTRSTRVDGRLDLWEFDIEPGSHRAVTLRLPATKDCAAAGAICTAGGRRLSAAFKAAVGGPPALSVADAKAREGRDETIGFAVTLSRAVSGEVTVDYATRDGTATAGEDYTAASGTLTFGAGETAKTVSVAVLDDAHDEGRERFTLRLSNAKGAWIEDGKAVGTIRNADAMPQAWIARFGRTVTGQVLDAVAARLEAPRQAGAQASLAGQALPSWAPGAGSAANDGGVPDGTSAAEAVRTLMAHAGASPGSGTGSDGGVWNDDGGPGFESRALTGRDFVTGTSFALTGGSAEDGGGSAALWGRGAIASFDGREGDLTLDGEVTTGLVGADWATERWTAGLAVGHSRGTGGYREGDDAGRVEAVLTGVYPYAGLTLTERLSVWAAAGYGSGELTMTPDERKSMKADLTMAMGAAGARSEVLRPEDGDGLALAVKGDARFTRTSSSKAKGGGMAAADADVWLLRAGIEGSRRFELGGGEDGATFTPSFEVGAQLDGGDAETGLGADMGGGIALADPKSGLTLDLKARGLLAHEASGFREWGASAALAFDPRPSTDRGLAFTLTQSWGASPAGGMDALLSRETMAGLAANEDGATPFEAASRLEGELGYGLSMFDGAFTGKPNIGFGLSDTGRDYRLGWRLTSAVPGDPGFEVGLDATRRETDGGGAPPEHGVMLRGTVRW